MIRRIVIILVACAALIGAAWFANGEGTLTFRFADYEIQTGAGTAALLLILFVTLLLVIARLTRFLFRAPKSARSATNGGE